MPRRAFLSVQDMTYEEIEERILAIERNYEEFFEQARDGFYISTRVGQFLDCNDALVKMLDYRVKEEVLTMDLNTDLWMNPEDRVVFMGIIERDGFVRNYEAVFKRKDGSPVYVGLSSYVWRDRKGNIGGYRGFVEDHTEARLIRDQLQSTELKYRELLENIHEGAFVSDPGGRVMDCNQAFLNIVGYSRDEFLNMNYYRDLFLNPDDVREFRRLFTRYGQIKDYELQVVRKDGTIRHVSMSGYAGRNNEGELISYQGLMRDITEGHRLRNQLVQSERLSAMGKMASQLAHELNNPIYGIMNCLELLKDAVAEQHARRKYLDLAYNECKRTSGLLIKMLKFFRPDEEKKVETDINKLLEETLLFYEKQFMNLNIRVKTEFQPDLPRIMGVESQLKQVFINMIINANTAMPSGGELRVASRLESVSEVVAVEIQDTGVGIKPEHLDKIFDAFFTTKKEVKGVGLGLSVCYGFIREHGGRIDVESEPGKGTKFTIYLPVNSNSEPHTNGDGR
ncbi:MAG: PAS domain S-box protein [Deltaproteobacteria bacterium]|nr:PAS domain S-box protein [Deltaproteobacteria bacterium]